MSAGELLTALEPAPLDTIYLDAAGQEKGEGGWQDGCVYVCVEGAVREGLERTCTCSQSVAQC